MWFGFIYTCNHSRHKFIMSLKPELEGCKVISHKPEPDGFIKMRMHEGHEELILIKRYEGNCKFGMRSKV